jgi:hypothetical protein
MITVSKVRIAPETVTMREVTILTVADAFAIRMTSTECSDRLTLDLSDKSEDKGFSMEDIANESIEADLSKGEHELSVVADRRSDRIGSKKDVSCGSGRCGSYLSTCT